MSLCKTNEACFAFGYLVLLSPLLCRPARLVLPHCLCCRPAVLPFPSQINLWGQQVENDSLRPFCRLAGWNPQRDSAGIVAQTKSQCWSNPGRPPTWPLAGLSLLIVSQNATLVRGDTVWHGPSLYCWCLTGSSCYCWPPVSVGNRLI